ncbi:acyl dehydratase [Halogeometricum borinquense DSM 11551]|uniref:Acyl dehydratase n=2 Tax=Halogeometricum borinquense TaxID=60847 RepID=E4NU15_HALBP|nr:acyl dehydratase [Halogeometricum borinquense DSM 11551]ELY25593.1 acyl dehydratase [Halogeometricum borinquense DSM 11551]RYJ08531.1 MaoC family dehydratase [Halogeometricum borinquense]
MSGDEHSQTTPAYQPQSLSSAWLRASEHVQRSSGYLFNGLIEANHAFIASLGGQTSHVDDEGVELDSILETRHQWSFERSVNRYEELGVGERVSFTKQLSSEDVSAFATISGDTNPLHLDDEFAKRTRFGTPIVHGTLISGLISAALARFPGVTIYLSQDLEFLSAAEPGGTLTATCEITEAFGESRYRLDTVVHNESGEKLADGEAIVLIDEPPEYTETF